MTTPNHPPHSSPGDGRGRLRIPLVDGFVDAGRIELDSDTLSIVSPALARQRRVVPLGVDEDGLHLAVDAPGGAFSFHRDDHPLRTTCHPVSSEGLDRLLAAYEGLGLSSSGAPSGGGEASVFARVRAEVSLERYFAEYLGCDLRNGSLGSQIVESRCPWHQERTPSLKIFSDQGQFRCFGACDFGGTIIDAVMRAERFASPIRAVEWLDAHYGLGLDDQGPQVLDARGFLERTLEDAVDSGATEIHLEGAADGSGDLWVRTRVDGVLRLGERLGREHRADTIDEVKRGFGLDVDERRKPQSGRSSREVAARKIGFRVRTIPAIDNEDIVIRIVAPGGSEHRHLERLGVDEERLVGLRRALERSSGLVLLSGPPDSGLTTSLYAALRAVADPSRKVVTVEDPVEVQLVGPRQVHVDPRAGRMLAPATKAVLEIAPDVLMVGTLDDTVSERLVAAAAERLVLSSLRAPDAASAIIRLLHLGVDARALDDASPTVVSERLIRRVCPECLTDATLGEEEYSRLARVIPGRALPPLGRLEGSPLAVAGEGCSACVDGYAGRVPLVETLLVGERVRSVLLSKGTTADGLREAAASEGMESIHEHGLARLLAGETSLGELVRVLR